VAERTARKSICGFSRVRRSCGIAALILLLGCQGLQTAIADGDTRTISLHHMHTDESITITYKRNGRYDEAALQKLNWFLRDWRREEQTSMDPRLFDLIWEVSREVGAQKPIEVVCGYRSPETNAMLRRRSGGVARFSQHMLGRAMDFYVPGVALEDVRIVGLRLQRGGVGYYPTSGSPFVHLDTGNVRHWPRMTREQLARVFPDGRTVHIPADGRPLAGYALALADLEKRGSNPSPMSLASARDAGVDIGEKPKRSLLAALFDPRQEREDDEDSNTDNAASDQVASARTASTASAEPRRAVTATSPKARQPATYELASAQTSVPTTQRTSLPASGNATASIGPGIGPWSVVADAAAPEDAHVAAEATALAYAAPSDEAPSSRPSAVRAAPMGTGPARASSAASFGANGATTILQKSIVAPAPRKSAALPSFVQSPEPAQTSLSAEVAIGNFVDDPWLRALVIAPNLKSYMTVTSFETPDFRELRPMMEKPTLFVKMTFSTEPNTDLPSDHFSGSAVVFLSTVNFLTRTASLQ
jgi:uncharacterized protein YcbK (DUF882 family)